MLTILVTGFGPFGSHKVNASWEVAKYLKNLNCWLESGIHLITYELPVAYQSSITLVPDLWKKYDPQLVIHMGVAGVYNEIKIETVARKNGYKAADIHGFLPEDGCCCIGTNITMCTEFDIAEICEKVKDSCTAVSVYPSKNAGNYLCEFTYYVSLNINPSRTVFIHVPDIDQPYSVPQMGDKVRQIIFALVEQIKI